MTATHIITRMTFNAYAAANRNNPNSVFNDDLGHIDYDGLEEDDQDAFDDMIIKLIWADTQPRFTVTDDSIMFTIENLDAAYAVTEAVIRDYDDATLIPPEGDTRTMNEVRRDKRPDSPWVVYDLGGDDCVDECGGLPQIAMDMIREYLASL